MMYVLFADLWSFSGKNGHNYIGMLVPTTSGGVQKKSWQPGKKQDLHIVYIHNVKSSLGFMI